MSEDPDERAERRERERLADRIDAAFAAVAPPTPPITARGADDAVERVLGGRLAGELTAADGRAVRTDLAYLTPAAFAYYLPALVRIALLTEDDVDGLEQSIAGMLTPPKDPAQAAFFDERVGCFDDAQRRALGEFVTWYSSVESSMPGRDRALAFWRS